MRGVLIILIVIVKASKEPTFLNHTGERSE